MFNIRVLHFFKCTFSQKKRDETISYFNDEETGFSFPDNSADLVPYTLKIADNYNIGYFITQLGETIIFNKMIWE